jgi:hypothetical protein
MVELDVRDPGQPKLIKKGDQIEAVYTNALAVSVEPPPAAGKSKKLRSHAAGRGCAAGREPTTGRRVRTAHRRHRPIAARESVA